MQTFLGRKKGQLLLFQRDWEVLLAYPEMQPKTVQRFPMHTSSQHRQFLNNITRIDLVLLLEMAMLASSVHCAY